MDAPTQMTKEMRETIIAENKEDFASRAARKRKISKLRKEMKETIRWHKNVRKAWLRRGNDDFANKASLFIHPLMFRSLELMESALADTKRGRLLSAISSTRTHYELTGTAACFLKELRKLTKGESDEQKIVKLLETLMMGVGSGTRKEFSGIDIASMHCNARVNTIDEIDPHSSEPAAYWKFYSDLCEYVHINYSTTTMTLRYYPDYSVNLYDYDRVLYETEKLLVYFSFSATKFWFFYREAMHILNQRGNMPPLLGMPKYSYHVQRVIGESIVKFLGILYRFGLWKPKKKKPRT